MTKMLSSNCLPREELGLEVKTSLMKESLPGWRMGALCLTYTVRQGSQTTSRRTSTASG